MLRLKEPLNVKLSRLSGRLIVSRLSFALHPKVKLLRCSGRSRPSKLWLKPAPNVKVWRLSGNITRHLSPIASSPVCKVKLTSSASCNAALSAKLLPRVKLWRCAGKVKFWTYAVPKLNVWRFRGRITCSRLWSKQLSATKASCWRLHGKATFSRLWLNNLPKFKAHKLSGKFTPARLWLNLRPNVKFRRAVGRVTLSKFLGRCWAELSHSFEGAERIIPPICLGFWMMSGALWPFGKSSSSSSSSSKSKIFARNLWNELEMPFPICFRPFLQGSLVCCYRSWKTLKIWQTNMALEPFKDHIHNDWPIFQVVMFQAKIWPTFGTAPRFWLKEPPKVSCWRLLGKFTSSRLASYWNPKVKLWRWHGSSTSLKLCLKWYPKVSVSRPLGNITPTRLASKYWPKVKCNLRFVSEPF